MGFTRGLDVGSRMARGWIDTYRSAQEVAEDREYKAKRKSIMDAQPEEGMSFTPEQGQRLAGIDPSRYSIGHDGSAYTVSDNENPQATQVIAPSSQYKFLGNQSASAYSPQQIDQMRGRALADLEAVRDPTKGLNLRAAVDTRYQAEKKIADEEALKVKTADFYKQMSSMPTRDLVQHVNGLMGPDGLGDITYNPQDGSLLLASNVPGVPGGNISRGDIMGILGQAFTAGNGNAQVGLPILMQGIEGVRKRQVDGLKTKADLDYKDALIGNMQEQREIGRGQLGVAHYNAETARLSAENRGARGGAARSEQMDPFLKSQIKIIETSQDLTFDEKQQRITTLMQQHNHAKTLNTFVERARQAAAGGATAPDMVAELTKMRVPKAQIAHIVQEAGLDLPADFNMEAPAATGNKPPAADKLPPRKQEVPKGRDAAPQDPAVEAAGKKLDEAREALKALRRGPTPGLAAGRAARDVHGERVRAAQEAVRAAEAEYQAALPQEAYQPRLGGLRMGGR